MEVIKKQMRMMYILLGIMYVIGAVICFIMQNTYFFSFTFGAIVSAVNLYLTYMAFSKLYLQKEESKVASLFVGPFPKLILVILGSVICYKLPEILPIVPFLIGVCLYAVTYLLFGVVDFLKK